MAHVNYALGLHMHQPPGNLKLLIESNEWEARQIIRCYERAARYAYVYKDAGCLHVGFSGVLLEQFQDPRVVDAYRKFVDIPRMIETYREAKNIEIIGMGFYHPIFPLIPKEDWAEQLKRGREIVKKLFGQKPKGFWPSEMAFCMEMIPSLVKAGYEYVIVDHVHVQPLTEGQTINSFKPYTARYEESSITIVPRNRDLSNAQESGMDAGWFLHETQNKLKAFPESAQDALVTTWSDGENGGWFRQIDEQAGFFGHFFAPLMERVKRNEADLTPVTIKAFLKANPPYEEASVRTGAWNVASTSGYDFTQWAGSDSQRKAIEALYAASRKYWEMKHNKKILKDRLRQIERAREFILNAETSCYLFWGDSWIPKIYDKLNKATELLQ